MSHVHITLNDEVMVDGDFTDLTVRPPQFVADIIDKMQPTSAQKPSACRIAIMGTMAEAHLRKVDITIDATTGPDWWTMTVKER